MIITAVATYTIFKLTTVKPENQEVNNPDVIAKTLTDDNDNNKSEWAKSTILQWLADYPQDHHASVILYDLDNDITVGEVAANDIYNEQMGSDLAEKVNLSFAKQGHITAQEALEVLKAAYRHDGMSDEDFTSLKESLLTQQDFYSEDLCQGDCKVRNGVPAGFQTATVYNENYMHLNDGVFVAYRDMSIIEFKINDEYVRSFAMVLLAEHFSEQADFAKIGSALEATIAAHIDEEQSN